MSDRVLASTSPQTPAPEARAGVGSRAFSCRLETRFSELEKLAADWDRLQNASAEGEIFQNFVWLQAWWQSFGKHYRVFTPIVEDGSRVVAVLPLLLDGRRLRFLGFSVSDYGHLLVAPEHEQAALEACLDTLVRHRGEWDELLLENVPESSALARSLKQLPAPWRGRMEVTPGESCPTLLLRENKAEALQGLLTKDKLKKTVRYLARHGALSFRHLEDPREVGEHLTQFVRQHVRRSAIAGRRSAFLDEDYLGFYQRLVTGFNLRSQVRFSVLELAGRPVAYHFGPLFRGKYLFYKPTFDVDLWELSPGQALLWYLFEHLQTTDVEEFDFGQGGESYKFRFSNAVRRNEHFTLRAPGWRPSTRASLRRVAAAARAQVRSRPRLEELAQTVRARTFHSCLVLQRAGILATLSDLFGDLIYRKRTWCFAAATGSVEATQQPDLTIVKAGLSELADLAVTYPHVVTESRLQDARKSLREGRTAWIVANGDRARAVVWTLASKELKQGTLTISLPADSMIVADTWMLGASWIHSELASLVTQLEGVAREQRLPLWVLLPRNLMASLKQAGVKPAYTVTCRQVFGRASWRLSDQAAA
jgi:CelD/BcsL family acetyltransferase involved in cellulose biosynthesis